MLVSRLASESDIQGTDILITDTATLIRTTDTGTTGRTMATLTTGLIIGTAATVTTDIIVTITIITGKVMLTWHSAKSQSELARSNSSQQLFEDQCLPKNAQEQNASATFLN